MSFGSFKQEFDSLLNTSTRLNGFAGFWSDYKPASPTEANPEDIQVVTGSKYFLLSFVEENKPSGDDLSGHPDFLKIITQMRLILSQTAIGSIVNKVCNFHNCICCHGILSSGAQVIILTLKPYLYKADNRTICIDYLLYLSGVYNTQKKEDRIALCNFLITSAYMASAITKLICKHLVEEETSQK